MPRTPNPTRPAAPHAIAATAIVDAAADAGAGGRSKRRGERAPAASDVVAKAPPTSAASLSDVAPASLPDLADAVAVSAIEASAPASPFPSSPTGKLGLLLARIEAPSGAAMADLTAATGWQPHTVRAALSRLRARGFPIQLESEAGRKIYRLARKEG